MGLIEAYLYVGWSSLAARKAWSHFEDFKATHDYSKLDPFLGDLFEGYIFGELAKFEPKLAIEALTSTNAQLGEAGSERCVGISFESRDNICKNLPKKRIGQRLPD